MTAEFNSVKADWNPPHAFRFAPTEMNQGFLVKARLEVFRGETVMREQHRHLCVDGLETFRPQPSRKVILINPLVTKPAQRVLRGVGAAHDHVIPLIELGLSQIAELQLASDWHESIMANEWGQANREKNY